METLLVRDVETVGDLEWLRASLERDRVTEIVGDLEWLRASRDRVLDRVTVGDLELLRARFVLVLVTDRVRVTDTVADLDARASR